MAEHSAPAQIEEQQKQIGSYLGRVLRDHFGKGPESVYVSVDPCCIVMHIRKFLSPIEKVMLDQRDKSAVEELRETMMSKMLPEIKNYIASLIDIEDWEFYFDWNIENKSGVITGFHPDKLKEGESGQRTQHQEDIKQAIQRVSEEVGKSPDEITVHPVNERTMLAVRTGGLILIEKELIRTGHLDVLKSTKRLLEKEELYKEKFNSIFGTAVRDIFVDWDFDRDRSLVVFVTDPI
ncbi:DUF2294 domain-containing protein [Marinococcus halophilus]|uniref:Na+-translocating membrane potential-generating system MpsC domain-containing protein n=1 Tax=Marinococcus halophilus TaxID=1371 RepID=A0A510Y9H8_MARHA|nr:Na-translocating system protein MpsC family protein [Marinococcus halophilus]OZT79909.1 DUF2294 domain-containing protein [Marinococcus halophilus]GEK60034.1 hypothetical protein MHA01_29390 [Marinococcus halophilus]